MLEDTATTGGSLIEAIEVAQAEGLEVIQAVVLVDRSRGEAARRVAGLGIGYSAVFHPEDLGLGTDARGSEG